ncbi:hypothetical protein Pst134EA_025932 [Puccinia striiformis f. sp. tritici]|uniref:hypothetical protein n=1 Tax=Puccinia striiformis f. sp. tritici TaxID=168172 RepID=UPI002007B4E7|nr:hypothetical protein Pst134EA_025932 [Puccinia striiformis f. sp. tritici]KAH9451995.1 hypothetical protein Pst134EA_025932 [Puccinia striiformis f. sp. tritici]
MLASRLLSTGAVVAIGSSVPRIEDSPYYYYPRFAALSNYTARRHLSPIWSTAEIINGIFSTYRSRVTPSNQPNITWPINKSLVLNLIETNYPGPAFPKDYRYIMKFLPTGSLLGLLVMLVTIGFALGTPTDQTANSDAACYGSCPGRGQPYTGRGCKATFGCRGP